MAEATRCPETRDVWPKALLVAGGGLLVFLVVAVVILRLIFGAASSWPLPGAASRDNEASPVLQTHAAADLAAFRNAEEKELHRLGWVDRDAGMARIPIEDAMQLVVRNGLPDRSDRAAPAKGAQPR